MMKKYFYIFILGLFIFMPSTSQAQGCIDFSSNQNFGDVDRSDWNGFFGSTDATTHYGGTASNGSPGLAVTDGTLIQRQARDLSNSGGSTKTVAAAYLPDAQTDADPQVYTISQSVYFEPGWDWVLGGKLGFGLGGGASPSGGQTNTDGFTSRFMWRPDGEIVAYTYNANRSGRTGDDYTLLNTDGSRFKAPIGQWFNIAMEVTMNSSASADDGKLRAFINGAPALNVEGFQWWGSGTPKIDKLTYSTFYGGSGPEWAPPDTNYVRFSDVCWIEGPYAHEDVDLGIPVIQFDEEQESTEPTNIIENNTISRGAFADGPALVGGEANVDADGNSLTGEALVDTALIEEWVASFMLMTQQFTSLMTQQVQIIGHFFDAKHQLETQRLFQTKVAEAHKDYQPSAELCEVGTFVRDLADSQQRTKVTRFTMAQAAIQRALASGDVKSYDTTEESDVRTRRNLFVEQFCNIHDNAGNYEDICDGNGVADQQNADVNYTQTIDNPLTLDVNFIPAGTPPTNQEENLLAFLDQIFMDDAFPTVRLSRTVLHSFVKPYQELRSLVAMRSVAYNSFAHIIAEKTRGPVLDHRITPHLYALMEEMGMSLEIIQGYLGNDPSYYAQMEVLTKKIYQHPEFIANLYDKPINVKRMKTALNAIKSMQDRDIYQAMLRREMLTSMILEIRLRERQNDLELRADQFLSTSPEQADIVTIEAAEGTFAE